VSGQKLLANRTAVMARNDANVAEIRMCGMGRRGSDAQHLTHTRHDHPMQKRDIQPL